MTALSAAENRSEKATTMVGRATLSAAATTLCIIFALTTPEPASADFFQYTDRDGTVVIVDDEGKIPAQYRKKIKSTKTSKNSGTNKTAVRIQSNKVFIPVTLSYRNRTVEATMLLDTGASMTTISINTAKRLGINPESTELGLSRVADGRMLQTFVTSLDYLSLGPKFKNNLKVSIMPVNGPPLPFDGLLGMDFLGDFNYSLDKSSEMINWQQ